MSASEVDQKISIRSRLSSADRLRPAEPTIDPGFVNRRLVETVLGEAGMSVIDQMTRRLPPHPDWQHEIRLDHIYKDVVLKFCEINGVLPLEQILAKGKGTLFSSVETLAPCPDVYTAERLVSHWVPRGETTWKVEFHYSTKWIAADTLRMRLHKGSDVAVVAHVDHAMDDQLICHPLVMGGAWLRTQTRIGKPMQYGGATASSKISSRTSTNSVRFFKPLSRRAMNR